MVAGPDMQLASGDQVFRSRIPGVQATYRKLPILLLIVSLSRFTIHRRHSLQRQALGYATSAEGV